MKPAGQGGSLPAVGMTIPGRQLYGPPLPPDPGPPGPAQRAGRSDTLHGMLCKQGALTPASGGRSKTQAVGSGRFAVLDDELDRLPAPVVVRGQPVGEAIARRGRLAGP